MIGVITLKVLSLKRNTLESRGTENDFYRWDGTPFFDVLPMLTNPWDSEVGLMDCPTLKWQVILKGW